MQPFHVSLMPDGVSVKASTSASGGAFFATIALAVTNRYDHLDMNALWDFLEFDCSLEADGSVVAVRRGDLTRVPYPTKQDGPSLSLDPKRREKAGRGSKLEGSGQGQGEVTMVKVEFEASAAFSPRVREFWLTVTGRLREDAPWAKAGHVVGYTQLELPHAKVWMGKAGPVLDDERCL